MNSGQELFDKFYHKTATAEERKALAQLLAQTDDDTIAAMIASAGQRLEHTDEIFTNAQANLILANIVQTFAKKPPVWLSMRTWKVAAAILAITIATGSAFYFQQQQKYNATTHKAAFADIAPGTSKAVLTLADGSTVALDQSGKQVIQQGNTAIQQNGSKLSYTDSKEHTAVTYNTLTTPMAAQFQLTLPDGTHVWLNAGSSIHFPTAFNQKERTVSVTGELYFEVAQNATAPFIVKVDQRQEIMVLGTSFNVNAYTNEPSINTTLTTGKLKVNTAGHPGEILQPGQQAKVSNTGTIQVQTMDVEQAIAWKDGWFQFHNAYLPEVMRQIARWYDLDVTFEGKDPGRLFEGRIQKDLPLSEVLQILEAYHVNFKINGKKIVVMPDK
jgi:transmembrane sensor